MTATTCKHCFDNRIRTFRSPLPQSVVRCAAAAEHSPAPKCGSPCIFSKFARIRPQTLLAATRRFGSYGNLSASSVQSNNAVQSSEVDTRPQVGASNSQGMNRFNGAQVLVTGCSRGVGLGLVKHLLASGNPSHVFATCRAPASAAGLRELQGAHAQLTVLPMDVTDQASVMDAMRALEGKPIDILINNAGISNPAHPVDPVLHVSQTDLQSVFQTNVMGTTLVTQAALPLMAASQHKIICNITSLMGSLDNMQHGRGGGASYRISKAAENMLTRLFAAELSEDGYTVVSMHPGWVATDMGSAAGREPPVTVDESATGILQTLSQLQPRDNGCFFDYCGKTVPW